MDLEELYVVLQREYFWSGKTDISMQSIIVLKTQKYTYVDRCSGPAEGISLASGR